MNEDEREALVEAVSGAFRERDADGAIRPHPAFADLDDAGRVEAFDVARRMRRLEAALDRDGLSTTARAVLDRVLRARPSADT